MRPKKRVNPAAHRAKAVATHCRPPREKPRSSPMAGRAGSIESMASAFTAINAAGSTDKDAIIAQLKATDLDCATGRITFNDHNDPIKSAFIMGFENGVPALVTRIDPAK